MAVFDFSSLLDQLQQIFLCLFLNNHKLYSGFDILNIKGITVTMKHKTIQIHQQGCKTPTCDKNKCSSCRQTRFEILCTLQRLWGPQTLFLTSPFCSFVKPQILIHGSSGRAVTDPFNIVSTLTVCRNSNHHTQCSPAVLCVRILSYMGWALRQCILLLFHVLCSPIVLPLCSIWPVDPPSGLTNDIRFTWSQPQWAWFPSKNPYIEQIGKKPSTMTYFVSKSW